MASKTNDLLQDLYDMNLIDQDDTLNNSSISDNPFEDLNKKPHIKMVVLGKTGAGKTTAINMILNQSVQKEYEEERLVAISQGFVLTPPELPETQFTLKCNISAYQDRQTDNINAGQIKSQTNGVNIYTINYEDYDLTLVDTPGLGDTRGEEEDKKHIASIVTGVQKLVEINAILYVHRASDVRQDIFLQYYVNQFKEMLTKGCQNNFIICYTMVVNEMAIPAKQVVENVLGKANQYIYFENDCLIPFQFIKNLFVEHYKKLNLKISQTLLKTLENYISQSKFNWNKNYNQVQQLLKYSLTMVPQKTQDLLDLHVKRETLVKIVCDKSREIQLQEEQNVLCTQKKNEIASIITKQNNIGPLSTTIPKTIKKSFTAYRTKYVTKKVNQKITFCHDCLSLCHNPCYLSEVYSRGNYNIINCAAFNGKSNCNTCSHNYACHGHTNEITEKINEPYTDYKYETQDEVVTDQNKVQLKQQLEQQKVQMQNDLKKQEQQQQQLNKKIESDYKKIALLYQQISQLAMLPMNDKVIEYLQQQMDVTKKDQTKDITTRDRLLKNYQKSLDNYNLLKKQIEIAQKQSQHQQNILSPQELTDLQTTLKSQEIQIMSSVKQSIQTVTKSNQQNNTQNQGVLQNMQNYIIQVTKAGKKFFHS